MLYGMLTPTAGCGFIQGKDILNDMDSIRKEIGVCP